MSRKKSFRLRRFPPMQFALYLLFRYVLLIFEFLDYKNAKKAGRLLGRIYYVIDGGHRKVARENIRRASGMPRDEAEIQRLIRRIYEHFGIGLVEMLLIPRMNKLGRVNRYVKLENFRVLDEALENGRGAIVVLGHLGNWEIAGLASSLKGYRIHSIARPIENPLLERYIRRVRSSTGQNIIPKHEAVKPMVGCLRNNGILVVLVDQDARSRGIFVPFFGRPASTVRSPALLALKYNAPIIVVNAYRSAQDQHRIILSEPIEAPRGLDREQAVEKITADFTAQLEAFIRQHPEQWMWLHQRWKTQPVAGGVRRESVGAVS